MRRGTYHCADEGVARSEGRRAAGRGARGRRRTAWGRGRASWRTRCSPRKTLRVVLVGDRARPAVGARRSTRPALSTALHVGMSTSTKQTKAVEMAHRTYLAVLGCGLRRCACNEEKSTDERERCRRDHDHSEVGCRVTKPKALLPQYLYLATRSPSEAPGTARRAKGSSSGE